MPPLNDKHRKREIKRINRQDKLKARAIRAGIRAAKKHHHVPTKEELLNLKIQVMPPTLRGFLVVAGGIMIYFAAIGWPLPADLHQFYMGAGGGLTLISGVVGVRHTLEKVGDSFANGAIDASLDGILSAIVGAIDF